MTLTLTNSVSADGDIVVREYKSEVGITLVVCQVPGPIVNGYFTLATEAHDDDGIPHTLEHLCFLGSEDYPYKGVLDMLANKCLAAGTNAWTDTDHTAYTISTAGPDGFLNILPIYLDHILYPTLTDEAFVTEVHHINGKGEDGGVVYCEMQGRENDGQDILNAKMLEALYPGDCGYKSITAGRLKNLRESLTNDKIKKYHASTYRPENLCIIVCGQIKDESLISVVAEYEKKIIKKRAEKAPEPFVRSWQSPVPAFTETVSKSVPYPCDDDDNGMVWFGWRGPSCVKNFEETIFIELLADYLSDNAVSPLQQKFVEIDDPFCSEISFFVIENSESCLIFTFESTCKKKVKKIESEFLELLKSIASSPESLDMGRMKNVIHRKRMQLLSSLESRAHSHVCSSVIGAFLYGQKPADLAVRLTQIPFYDEAEKKGPGYWCELINKYFLSQPHVVIIGEPSPSLQKKLAKDEKERIAQQIAALGPAGLEEQAKKLEHANTVNNTKPPRELLNAVPIASTDNISYHEVKQLNVENCPELNLLQIPYKIQVDDIKSNFVTLSVFMNTTSDSSTINSDFDVKLRPYLTLLTTLITETAIDRDGTIIPYQDVVTQLDADTIECAAAFGIRGRFTQLFGISMKIEIQKYVKGINWLRELIFQTVFEEERISVVLKKMLNDLNTKKRKGSLVCHCLLRGMTFDERSNEHIFIIHEQIKFLNNVSQRLKKDANSVINDLNALRSIITQSENIIIHISLDQAKVAKANGNIDIYAPWVDVFLPKKVRQESLQRVTRPIAPAKDLFRETSSLSKRGAIAGLGSVDSNYMEVTYKYATSPTDPDLPALLVLSEYLSQLEGPLWREVRGNGLAYGCYITLNVHENSLSFALYRSTLVHQAYQVSKDIVDKHLQSDDIWDQSMLEASRSSLMYSLISKEKSLGAAASQSFLDYLLKLDINHSKDLVTKISKVTLDDVKKVAPLCLKDLFNDEKICKSVVCNTSTIEDTIDKFKKLGVTLEKFDLESAINLDSKL